MRQQNSEEKLAKAVMNRNMINLEKKVQIMAKMVRKEDQMKLNKPAHQSKRVHAVHTTQSKAI